MSDRVTCSTCKGNRDISEGDPCKVCKRWVCMYGCVCRCKTKTPHKCFLCGATDRLVSATGAMFSCADSAGCMVRRSLNQAKERTIREGV